MKEAKRREFPHKGNNQTNPEVEMKERKSLAELTKHMKDSQEQKSYAQTRKMLASVVNGVVKAQGEKNNRGERNESTKALAKMRVLIESNEKLKKDERKRLERTLGIAERLITDQAHYQRSLSLEKTKTEKNTVEKEISAKKAEANETIRNLKTEASKEVDKIIADAKSKADGIINDAKSEAQTKRDKTASKIKGARDKNKILLGEREDKFSKRKETWKAQRDEEERHLEERKHEFNKQKEDHRQEHDAKMDLLKKEREDFVQWRKEKRQKTKVALVEMRQKHRNTLKERRDEHNQKLRKMREDFKQTIKGTKQGIRDADKKNRLRRQKANRYFNELKDNFLDASPVVGMVHDLFQGVRGLLTRKPKDDSEKHLENIDKNMEKLLVEQKTANGDRNEDRRGAEENSLRQMEADREKGFNQDRIAGNGTEAGGAANANNAEGGGNGLLHGLLGGIAASFLKDKLAGPFVRAKEKVAGGISKAGSVVKDMSTGAGAAKGGKLAAATKILNPIHSMMETTGAFSKLAAFAPKAAKLARLSGIVNVIASVYAIGDGIMDAQRMFGRKIEKTDVIRRAAGGVIGFMSSWVELVDIVTLGKFDFKGRFEKGAASIVDGFMKFYSDIWSAIKKGSVSDIFTVIKGGLINVVKYILDNLIPGGSTIKNMIFGKDDNNAKKVASNSGPIAGKVESVKTKKAEAAIAKQNEQQASKTPVKSNTVVDNSVKNTTTNVINPKLSTRNYDTSMYYTLYGPKLNTH